jgi:hypothetical protein
MPRVAVGGAEEYQHLLAFTDRDIADLDRAGGGSEEGLHRALIASSNAARATEESPRSRANSSGNRARQ